MNYFERNETLITVYAATVAFFIVSVLAVLLYLVWRSLGGGDR